MSEMNFVARKALLALAAAIASPAWAANECKVEYGFFTGTGPTRQDQTQTVNLNAGQTLSVNRSNMNFVRNTGGNKVDVTLTGAISNKFTLDKDQRNPSAGFYLTPVTLVSLHCTHGATVSAPSTPEQLVNQLKQANAGVNQIAQQLKTTFNQTGQQVAGLLKAAGYGASQVAAALASAFNATGAQVAAWLKAAGYTGEQVAAALKAQFNATAAQAAGWLKDAFNATGEQVAAWLKAAGYTGEQVAAALKAQFNATAAQAAGWLQSAFNATTQQLAQWLRGAGYTLVQVAEALDQLKLDPAQAMAAVRQAFNATWTEAVNAYRAFVVVLQPTYCGVTGCNQGAQLLRAAGAAAADALKALRDAYNLSESAARQMAQGVFGLAGQAIDTALAAAGYAATQANRAVAEAMELRYVLLGSSFRECGRYPSGTIYGTGGGTQPLPLPATGTAQVVTFIGNTALAAATAINDLPAGARYVIRERGPCFFVADITVPSTAREGVSGRGVLMSSAQPGPGFAWRVGPVPSTGGTPIYVPRPAPSSPLRTEIDRTTLYLVGGATTTDANGNNYTLLETTAPHCQTVAAPNPAYNANGAQNARRATITVANIAWRVTNTGATAVQGVTAELVRGSTILASHGNLTVAAGQTLTFNTPRPQNQTCVARLGGGDECYHCGMRDEGWNDNEVSVRIR
jgi:transcriptional regulator with XRE-family HTH domain